MSYSSEEDRLFLEWSRGRQAGPAELKDEFADSIKKASVHIAGAYMDGGPALRQWLRGLMSEASFRVLRRQWDHDCVAFRDHTGKVLLK